MATTNQFDDYMSELDPNEPFPADDVAAMLAAAAPVKIWILYTGDEDHPAEARFYSSKGKAMRRAEELAAPGPDEDYRLEWRPAVQGDGLPLYAGPEPVVPKPELFPDYLALFQVKPDGSESFYWQIDSTLLDADEEVGHDS